MRITYKKMISSIKHAVLEIDLKDSDWDILILIDKPQVSIKDEQVFRHKLVDLELETGQVLSTFVYSLKEWATKYAITPLYQNIQQEGILL